MAKIIWVHAVFREREGRIRPTEVGERDGQQTVRIDYVPPGRALGDQPRGIVVEDVVVTRERFRVGVEAGGQGLRGDRHGIEDRWGHVDDCGARGDHSGLEARHAIAKFREAFFREGKINPVVHPVAGDDDVRLGLREDACETFVEIGAGKFSAGVADFGKSRNGFARETEGDDFAVPSGHPRAQDSLDEIHVGAAVGNAVAEEDDPFGGGEHRR